MMQSFEPGDGSSTVILWPGEVFPAECNAPSVNVLRGNDVLRRQGDPVLSDDERLTGHRYAKCTSASTGICAGCSEGMDCKYTSLAMCTVCGGLEGSLLPACPREWRIAVQHDDAYRMYCEGIGPFARLDKHTAAVALEAIESYAFGKDLTDGAAQLYEAFLELVAIFSWQEGL